MLYKRKEGRDPSFQCCGEYRRANVFDTVFVFVTFATINNTLLV